LARKDQKIQADPNVYFLYTHNGTLEFVLDPNSPAHHGQYGNAYFRDNGQNQEFIQYLAPVICEEKWSGRGDFFLTHMSMLKKKEI